MADITVIKFIPLLIINSNKYIIFIKNFNGFY